MTGVLNLVLGTVYTGFGVLTVLELKRGWRTFGFSPFGVAWVAMAFTCGPHHLEHASHILVAGRDGAPVDLLAVAVGLPAGATWLFLRIEAMSGGRGDRFIAGTPRWLALLPYLAGLYILVFGVVLTDIASSGAGLSPRLTPNLLLVGAYCLIGYYLLRTQLANRPTRGGWSLSGLSLSVVFPTCAFMHAAWLTYAMAGRYEVDAHLLAIDWLSVPAAIYFLQVVRGLYLGAVRDWNRSTVGVVLEVGTA